MRKNIVTVIAACCISFLHAQTAGITYAEKLGYPKGAKVVILHVDDAGMSYDSNEGVFEAITKGVATSTSVMMPCPWVPGFVHRLKQYPQLDAGLHLTLTSEWKDYRWGPLAGKEAVPGLVDNEGDLWPSVAEVAMHATPDEVEKEIRAQLARARSMGFTPTHLDSHMGTLFATPGFLERYLKVGMEEHIPVMLPAGHDKMIQAQLRFLKIDLLKVQAQGRMLWNAGLPVLDDLDNNSYDWPIPDSAKNDDAKLQHYKTAKYIADLKQLQPGVTMIIMHCTATSPQFKYISNSGDVRRGDLLAMLDPAFKKALEDEHIILTTWRELMQRRMKAGN
ncbi:MAG TPA: polysaccharide deacetylase family protein [Chitinophagaceae bacterium]|nr:polysaccharide deacetylase family protein [Chitinophagaceae bacterium]